MKKAKDLRKIILPFILVLEITVFPILFLYLKNISETSFADIYKILLLHALLGIILFLILCTILKNINKGAIVATLFIVVLSNYMLFEMCIRDRK